MQRVEHSVANGQRFVRRTGRIVLPTIHYSLKCHPCASVRCCPTRRSPAACGHRTWRRCICHSPMQALGGGWFALRHRLFLVRGDSTQIRSPLALTVTGRARGKSYRGLPAPCDRRAAMRGGDRTHLRAGVGDGDQPHSQAVEAWRPAAVANTVDHRRARIRDVGPTEGHRRLERPDAPERLA